MTDPSLLDSIEEALSALPTRRGGTAVVLATAGSPPAMALLSAGDIRVRDGRIRIGIHASSSAVDRLGGAFTVLVPLGALAVRVEVAPATATVDGPMAILEGEITAIRPTAEPPWMLEMRFRPEPEDDPMIPDHIKYWSEVAGWLSGELAEPPQPPR